MSRSLATFAGAALAAALLAGCGKPTPITSAAAPTPTPFVTRQGVEYAIPTANSAPVALTRASDGSVWFVENAASKLAFISSGGQIAEYPLPSMNSAPTGVTEGPDQAMWVTEQAAGKIARTSIVNVGSFSEVNLTSVNPAAKPFDITAGADGAMWATDPGANGVWRISVTTTPVAVFTPIGTANASPGRLTNGPDGQIWFVDSGDNKIASIPSGSAGLPVTEYSIPTAAAGLTSIAPGDDNALWFIESAADKIGRINLSGQVTAEYSLAPLKTPIDLTIANDGNFYITDSTGNQIGQFNPITQKIATFPTTTANSTPWGIGIGPDGEIYFAEKTANQIGQLLYF